MKVEKSMIAKDLRFMGKVYTKILTYPNLNNPENIKRKKTKSKKNSSRYYCTRPDGSNFKLLISKPKNSSGKKVPGVLWIHGGGYFSGIPEQMHIAMSKTIKNKCVIVSPDYRLSTEAPYPAALNDCYLALKWMRDNSDQLGINSDQLFVGGESAGGGLTSALCLYARDKGEINIAFQMPLYPMIDCRGNSKSMKDNDAPVWNERDNKNAWNLYIGDTQNKISPYASAALTDNYKGMPPMLTFVGSIEPFYCETIDYIKKLKKCDIPVSYEVYKGCYHGFDMLVPWAKESKAARLFFKEGFEYACSNYYSPQPK